MPSVGERLRDARLEQGKEIGQAADELRVNRSYLEAIEAEDLSSLPGEFFARSFIRQYAQYLGISGGELKPEIDRLFPSEAAEAETSLKPKSPVSGLGPVTHVMEGGRRPRRRLLGALVALIAVIAACAAFYSYWLKQQAAGPISVLPDEPPAAAEPAPESVLPPVESEQYPAEAPQVAGSPLSSPGGPAPRESEGPAGPLWFEIRATEETWVRVQSAGRTLFVGILNDGEVRRFSGITAATMRVGNAGGLNLIANGRPAGPLGPRGQIRIITLTPAEVDISEPPPVRTSPIVGEEDEENQTG